jgi:hypothetical protein
MTFKFVQKRDRIKIVGKIFDLLPLAFGTLKNDVPSLSEGG